VDQTNHTPCPQCNPRDGSRNQFLLIASAVLGFRPQLLNLAPTLFWKKRADLLDAANRVYGKNRAAVDARLKFLSTATKIHFFVYP
jgi:hypothetical protein